jgi:uroporphyrinogen decarboxylase
MAKRIEVMTDRQRVEVLLQRRKPDRVPILPFAPNGFAVLYNNLSINDAYTNPEGCYSSLRKACQDFGWVFFPAMGYASMGAWEFGGEVRMPTGEYDQAPMVTRYPVENEEDVYNLKWPGPDSGFFPIAGRFTELARQESLDYAPFNAIISAGGAFNFACNVVGEEKFLRWLIKKPDLARDLIKQLADWELAGLRVQREMMGTEGVMGILAGATMSNQMISPRQFKEFAFPYIKEGQERLRSLGYKTTLVHICGEQNLNLPFWSQVPFGDPGIISIGHEIELGKAAEYFPDDIIFGNLEPVILQSGTPDEVYEATRKVVEEGKKLPNGYIFSTGCDLPPRTPVENIRMMTRAVEDFGWYE